MRLLLALVVSLFFSLSATAQIPLFDCKQLKVPATCQDLNNLIIQINAQPPGSTSFAPPTGIIGTAANPGVLATAMRSDATPQIPQCSNTVFGACKADGSTIVASGGVLTSTGGTNFANPTATIGTSAVNGVNNTAMRSDAAPAIPACTNAVLGACRADGTTISATGGVLSAISGGGNMVGSGASTLGNILQANNTGTPLASAIDSGIAATSLVTQSQATTPDIVTTVAGHVVQIGTTIPWRTDNTAAPTFAVGDVAKSVELTFNGAITSTLPAAFADGSGFVIQIGPGTLTLTAGSGTINGAASLVVGPYQLVTLSARTGNWYAALSQFRPQVLPFSWGPGMNLATVAIPLLRRPIVTVISAITCTPGGVAPASSNVDIWYAAQGITAANVTASGTKLTATTCNAAGGSGTTQGPLQTGSPVVPAGQIIWVVGSGVGWSGTLTGVSGEIDIATAP